jgi:signal transduction histidine kinase
MNGILGYSSLLVDVNLPRSSREQYVHYIQHSGQYLLKIITDIIEIAKIESRQIAIQSENFNLVQLLAEVFNEYKQKTPIEKSIILYNIGCQKHDSLQIHHDKTKIQYVISTLINNALKYTLEGYVEFGCIADTNTQQLRFYVKDTGIGISSENLRVVFDRFRQLDTSEKIFQTGTGLGLTICKSYVELMQGSIWAESEKDQGSTFWFVLPYNMAQNNTKTHE